MGGGFCSGGGVSETCAAKFELTVPDNEHKSSVVVRVPAVRIRAAQPYQALFSQLWTFGGSFTFSRLASKRCPKLRRSRGEVKRAVKGAVKRALNGATSCTVAAALLTILAPTLLTACNDEYTLAPTFCDDWCAAVRPPEECARGPASCVRDCELTKAEDACFPLQQKLLGCYRELPDDAFACAPPGFSASYSDRQRVLDGACRAERDALFECESPGFQQCLELCRGYQQLVTAGAPLGGVPVSDECPLLTQPCETLCWTAFVFTGGEDSPVRLPSGDLQDVLGDGGTAGNPIAALLAPCFQTTSL